MLVEVAVLDLVGKLWDRNVPPKRWTGLGNCGGQRWGWDTGKREYDQYRVDAVVVRLPECGIEQY